MWWGHWAGETCEDSGDDRRIVLVHLTLTHAQPEHATHTNETMSVVVMCVCVCECVARY